MEDDIEFIKSEYQDLKSKFREHRKSSQREIFDLKRQLGMLGGGVSVASPAVEVTTPAPATSALPCMTEGGKACIFPFEYEGESRAKCIQKWSDRKPWCPTKLDADGNFVSSLSDNTSWDYCDFSTNCSK